LLLNLPSFIRE